MERLKPSHREGPRPPTPRARIPKKAQGVPPIQPGPLVGRPVRPVSQEMGRGKPGKRPIIPRPTLIQPRQQAKGPRTSSSSSSTPSSSSSSSRPPPRTIAFEEEEDEWAPTAEELALAEAAEAEAPHDVYDERTAAKDAEDLEAEMFQEAEYDEEDAEPQHLPKKPKLSQGHLFICSYICILDEIERLSLGRPTRCRNVVMPPRLPHIPLKIWIPFSFFLKFSHWEY